jgi:hypothetical protein
VVTANDILDRLPGANRTVCRSVIWVIAAGTLLRLVLAAISKGSDDAVLWEHFAWAVQLHGFFAAYRDESMLNHPPLMVLWAWISLGARPAFAFVMKLPAIAADAAACALLAGIWLDRAGPRIAARATRVTAFSLLAVLMSAYHCNTDSVYAYLSLLAAYMFSDRRDFLRGGLILGLAINVKLIPMLLVPGAMSLCRDRRDFLRLIAGLSIGVIPFLPLVLAAPEAVYRNMISYTSQADRWGVPMLLLHAPDGVRDAYLLLGRWLIIAAVAAVCVISHRSRRWNAYELFILIYAAFLILAPGFGVQYSVCLFPLLVAFNIPRAWIYGTIAGIFLLIVYWSNLSSYHLPLLSKFASKGFPWSGALVGLLAWAALVEIVVKFGLGGRTLHSKGPLP